MSDSDVVVIGGGHNGLVAAAYLARAGLSVRVLERRPGVGGAAVSYRAFPGVDVRLSRYSYLVSLLPQRIIDDLGLRLTLRRRRYGWYTPVRRDGRSTGLLVDNADPARRRRRSGPSPVRTPISRRGRSSRRVWNVLPSGCPRH